MALEHVVEGGPHVAAHNEERDAINDNTEDIANRIIKPANPKVGDILRWDGGAWAPSAVRLLEGEGQPEGVVAAPVGSRYTDISPTAGAVEWVKVSGTDTSNTGWVMRAGDTFWRDVKGAFNMRSNGTAHTGLLRRTLDVVDFYVDLTMPTNEAAPFMFYDLPTGFRPDFIRHGALQDNKEGAATNTMVDADGSCNLYGLSGGKRDRWNGTWTTRDPWPSVLPGAPL